MARQSLAQLLGEDPAGTIAVRALDAESREEERATSRFPPFPEVAESMRAAVRDPEKRSVIGGTDWNDAEQVDQVAELLGVAPETLLEYRRERAVVQRAFRDAARLPDLKRSWALLLPNAPIEEATRSTLRTVERPFLVLFTADWCRWCWVAKPTFARLSHHFTAAKLFYTNDEDLARAECEQLFWPQLVGYREDGSKEASDCGDTTSELWEAMHRVVGAPVLAHA